MPDYNQILYAIEVHSVDGIKQYFNDGGDPNEVHDGVPLFTTMVEMYYRSPKFKDCVQAFIDAGLKYKDNALLAVLAHDAGKLKACIDIDSQIVDRIYAIYNNAYTPLTGGTLMHFCAEYNSLACAEVLLQHGADVNAGAAIDEYGFGGHTPIFHTVNQNGNNSIDMLHFLLQNGAGLSVTVKGLIWGKGYEWETLMPAVNPISYAMMGSLPQVHRKEVTVMQIVTLLLKYAYGVEYVPKNVPNAYLKRG
jgi:hypothetical protein